MPSFLCWLPYNLLIHLGLKATVSVPEYLRTSRFNTCGNWRHYTVFAFPLHFLFHCHVFYSFPLLSCPYLERAETSFRFLPHLSSWRLCILLLIDSHVWVMAKMACLISLTNHLHPHFCLFVLSLSPAMRVPLVTHLSWCCFITQVASFVETLMPTQAKVGTWKVHFPLGWMFQELKQSFFSIFFHQVVHLAGKRLIEVVWMICLVARKDTAQGQNVPEYCLRGRKGAKLFFFPSLVLHAVTQNEGVLVAQPRAEIAPSHHPCTDCKKRHQKEQRWTCSCPVSGVIP